MVGRRASPFYLWPMLRTLVFGILSLIIAPSLFGQSNHYKVDLAGDTAHAIWSYESEIKLDQDSLLIHIPLQAYIDKESFLNQQLREFQDPDLHFARKGELAFIKIQEILINGEAREFDLRTEFLHFQMERNHKFSLQIEFDFILPSQKFTGNGRGDDDTRIIDLLPRLYTNKSQAHPLSYYYDTYYQEEHFEIELQLGSEQSLVANLPFRKSDENQYYIAGEAKHVQLFIASNWTEYQLTKTRKLYLPKPDENFYRNFKFALEESSSYFKSELNDSLNSDLNFIFLEDKKAEYQSEELISLKFPKDWMDLRIDLVQAQAEAFIRYRAHTDGWQNPWVARGLPYYYKYHFIEKQYPQKRWIPFQSPILNGLFGFDEFDYGYQNKFLFLFLQRQGLDQALSSPVDSLSRLNYEAIVQAKASLLFSHLRAYTGDRDFKRGMAKMLESSSQNQSAQNIENALNYYCPRDLNWFFGPAIKSADLYDYQLSNYDHCPTVSTATVVNRGDLTLPYSLTGFKDGKPILTEWFEGHEGKKTVQIFHDEYDKVVLNAHLIHAEYRQKNNTYYDRSILPRMEPLSFQLYNSFEAAEATQIFYVPSLYYNAYDQFLLGLNLSNRSILVQKPFEYTIVPEYSTGTGKLTGTASAAYNWITPKNHFFRHIRLGVYSRYNHYDQDLAYYRISPSLNLRIRKRYPRSPYIQSLRLRGVILNREVDPSVVETQSNVETASYTVINANYRLEYTSLLRPTIFRFHVEAAEQFSKIFAEYDQRWMLPNKKWLILRAFAGGFLSNKLAAQGQKDNFYSLGLSGTPDYLFDYYFIGRSDQSGIWSRQFFTTDGGFKSETQAFADSYLLSTNLSVPFYGPFGAFADVALSEEQYYWDYGVRLALLTDFLEIYLPIQNQDRNFYSEPNYLSNARFVLDLNLGNIINRVRRGFY